MLRNNKSHDIHIVENKLKYWAGQLHDLSERNRLLYYHPTKSSSALFEYPEFREMFESLVVKGKALSVPLPAPGERDRLEESAHSDATETGLDEFGMENVPGEEKSERDDIKPLEWIDIDEAVQEQEILEGELIEDGAVREQPDFKMKVKYPNQYHSRSKSNEKRNEVGTNHSTLKLNRVMYNLRYMARTVQEEQGIHILYLTFGMLKWRETRSNALHSAPLLMVPVNIQRENPNSPFKIKMAEEDIILNPVLQIKLAKDFGLQLPEISNDINLNQLVEFLGGLRDQIQRYDGWQVEELVSLGVFNFLTLLLIRDFEKYDSLYSRHPLVQRLSGSETAVLLLPEHVPQARELDDLVDPSEVYQVLDADSSQQEAIEAAKRGLSFILQGPPGTGKSQTIANIIVESMMAGKKVLFVSQKMAALEVVKNRLAQKGLGEFCLEIHSHKMDKRRVVHDLMNSLAESPIKFGHPDHQLAQKELKRIRDELNTYVRQLHEPRFTLGFSLYQAQGALAQLHEAPHLEFSLSDLDTLTSTDLSNRLALVRELGSYAAIMELKDGSFWKGYKGSLSSLEQREEIASRFRDTADAIEAFHLQILKLSQAYRLPPPETIQDDMDFYFVSKFFRPAIFSSALKEVIDRYLAAHKSIKKYVDSVYREDAAKLRSLYRTGVFPSGAEIQSSLGIVRKIVVKRNVIVSDRLVDYEKDPGDLSAIGENKHRIQEGLEYGAGLFESNELPAAIKLRYDQQPAAAEKWFHEAAEHTGELAEWSNFNSVKQECFKLGLQDFVDKALHSGLPADTWPDAFSRRFYSLLIEKMITGRPKLEKFRGATQSDLVRRFKELDLMMIENNSREIKRRLSDNKPQRPWMEAGSAETAILRRESNKKRRLKPLRKLFTEIHNLIQALKPCLMMSPLTVCQLLDPAIYQFDLAVFDEASQIPPEYAISAILRSKQVIVAGDAQQLPPMNFFHAIENDDYDTDPQEGTYESILSACDSCGFPNKMLNWHYRSKDESLIAYSNYHFYDNRLYTFPSSSLNNPTTGLKFEYVKDGVYQPGEGARYNLPEARRVAELVHEHLTKNPELSLGVVAFSVPQRQAIEMEVEHLLRQHPDLSSRFTYERDEPIFIKNLENVQGDERDVIILSVGYGRDPAGRVALNFGPINRDGGTRRLNVAVTRARYLLKLVTSIQPEDIDLGRASSRGAALLRNYLEAARDGIRAVYRTETKRAQAEFDSLFEESVYHVLSQHGLQLVPEVGVSQYRIDLAVVDPDEPGRYLLGIECDGPMYYSALTARDRDRLRQQVLEGLGWKIHRIWSRDWITNREEEIAKVLRAVDEHRNKLNQAGAIPTDRKLSQSSFSGLAAASLTAVKESISNTGPIKGSPYSPSRLVQPGVTGRQAFLDAPLSQIIDGFQFIANNEGPISLRMAKARLLETWEIRGTQNIIERLETALQRGQEQKAYRLNGNFLWPLGNHVAPLRIHHGGKRLRDIEDIAPEEIEVAIRECIKSSLTIGREDLVRETLRLFGLKVLEANALQVEKSIKAMLAGGVLKIEKEKVSKGGRF